MKSLFPNNYIVQSPTVVKRQTLLSLLISITKTLGPVQLENAYSKTSENFKMAAAKY